MSLRKFVLKICSKLNPFSSVISIRLLCNFIEITLQHGCSPVIMLHVFRTSFYKVFGGLLLELLNRAAVVQEVVQKSRVNFRQYFRKRVCSIYVEKISWEDAAACRYCFRCVLRYSSTKNLSRSKRGFGKKSKGCKKYTLSYKNENLSLMWRNYFIFKSELFQILANELLQQGNFKQLVVTKVRVIVSIT